jgi:hypothetical protein
MKYRKKPIVIEAYQLTHDAILAAVIDRKPPPGVRVASANYHPDLLICFAPVLVPLLVSAINDVRRGPHD